MQLIFEDEMKMKGFKNALEDGVKMNIWAYLALLPITHKKWRKHCIYQHFRHF